MSHWIGNAFGVLIFFLLIQSIGSRAKFLIHNSTFDDAVSIAKCLLAVTDFNGNKKSTVIITDEENTNEKLNTDACTSTLTKSLAQAYIPQIVIRNWQYLSDVVETLEGNIVIIFYISWCNSLQFFNRKINQNHKKIIIINDKLKQKCNIDLIALGQRLQHEDATFIVKDTNNSGYELLTAIPQISKDTCQYDNKVSLTHVNTCTNGKLKDTVVFPSKTPKNFKMCDFKVGMATMYPYAMAKDKNSLRNLQQLSENQIRGSDVEIIKIISKHYNALLKIYYINREEENPYLHQEYLSYLINGSLDVGAGGQYRIFGDLVYYSGIYTRQAVLWAYTVEREPKSWQIVMITDNILYMFILLYTVYSIIWILSCKFDDIRVSCSNTFLYSWGALMGSSSLQESITCKQKILNTCYLFLCLHLATYLNVQIYSFFTIQTPPPTLETNEDVMVSGRTLYLQNTSKYFIEDAKYRAFAETSKECANFHDCEQKMLLNKGLTIMPEGYFHHLQASTAVENEAKVMRSGENIFVIYHEFLVRKDSPFAGKFKSVVLRLFEAVICDWLYVKALGLLIKEKAKNANANIMTKSYRCESGCAINISKMSGAIIIWLMGCVLALIVFVIEVITNKNST